MEVLLRGNLALIRGIHLLGLEEGVEILCRVGGGIFVNFIGGIGLVLKR